MGNEREKDLQRIEVHLIKGKYQFKRDYRVISEMKNKILYSGPIDLMQPIMEKIYRILRHPKSRICSESRGKLKDLEERSKNLEYFKIKGITHIIIYKCLQR